MFSSTRGSRKGWSPATRDVVLARLVSSTGVEAAFIVGLWGKAAFEFRSTPGQLAAMSAVIAVAALIGSTVGGTAVDRFGPKRVVITAEIVFVPATLAMVLAGDMTALIAIGVVSWCSGAVLETAIVSLPPLLVEDAELERTNARLESANWTALIIGPAVAAPLVAVAGIDAVFVFDALTSVVALGLLSRIQIPDRATADAAGHAAPDHAAPDHAAPDHDVTDHHVTAVAKRGDAPDGAPVGQPDLPHDDLVAAGGIRQTIDGFRYALGVPGIRMALYIQGLVTMAFGVFVALEPLFFRDVVGVEVEVIGYVNAVFGAGLLAGSLLLERRADVIRGFRWLIGLTFASGFGGVLYVATPDLRVIVLGAIVWSIPLGASLPLTRTLAQRHAAPAFTGRVMGAFGVVSSAGALLPLALAPALAAAVGVQAVLAGSAALALLGAPLALRRGLAIDAESRPAAVASSGSPRPDGQVGDHADEGTTEGHDVTTALAERSPVI